MIKVKSSLPKHDLIDVIEEEPIVTFSHLATCDLYNVAVDENQSPVHGFPSPPEEILYETGFLIKIFLKC